MHSEERRTRHENECQFSVVPCKDDYNDGGDDDDDDI
jgi:hypothetical protein